MCLHELLYLTASHSRWENEPREIKEIVLDKRQYPGKWGFKSRLWGLHNLVIIITVFQMMPFTMRKNSMQWLYPVHLHVGSPTTPGILLTFFSTFSSLINTQNPAHIIIFQMVIFTSASWSAGIIYWWIVWAHDTVIFLAMPSTRLCPY